MAKIPHFLGSVQGPGGYVTRRGTAASGLHLLAQAWGGAVVVHLYERDGQDYARVSLGKAHGLGVDRVLWDGPIDGSVPGADGG